MIRFILKRLARLIPLFIGITFVSFLVIHLAPGDPLEAKNQLNSQVTPQAREKLVHLYGLDQPILTQYANWCVRVASLDFGNSFTDGKKVIQKIGEAAPITLTLQSLSLALMLLAGVTLGIFSASRKDSPADACLNVTSLFFISLPVFWSSLLLLWLFSVHWGVLPVSGVHSLFYEDWPYWRRASDFAQHLALPVLASSLAGGASLFRFMRSSMREVLSQNYIRAAYARGLSKHRILYGHALKNAILPVITIVGLSIPGLLGGSVVIESIFSIPGMGRLFFNSVFTRDYPVIMGILTLGAFLTLLGNTLADAVYAWADPRIRHEKR